MTTTEQLFNQILDLNGYFENKIRNHLKVDPWNCMFQFAKLSGIH
jgi:hypothetical protein